MSLGRANTVTFNDVSRSNINVENNPFEIIDKILHSLMFSSRSKIIFSDQYNYVLCIGSRFIQWLYRFGAIVQFTVNTERIFTL